MLFTSKIQKLDSNVWSYCFFVPFEISTKFIVGNDRRVLCKINNSVLIHAALMPNGENNYFINLNKEHRKEIGLNIGDKITVEIQKDNSKYGMPFPVELEELILQDEEGNKVFHSLTLGKQRNLIHIVGKFKSSEKRIEKSIVIIKYLKSVQGKLDFKELNEAFKSTKF